MDDNEENEVTPNEETNNIEESEENENGKN